MRRDTMLHVINVSINQTLGRTVITSGTALLTALALFFFGGEVLHGFAFTMIVGIVTGTYSSVFIARRSSASGAAPRRRAPRRTRRRRPRRSRRSSSRSGKTKPARKARAS
jgi:preprotein translocase subunit SecF